MKGAAVGRDIAYNNQVRKDKGLGNNDDENNLRRICARLEEDTKSAQEVLLDITSLRDEEKKRAVGLSKEASGLYELAKEVVANGDDEAGKKFLTKRQGVLEKCKIVMKNVSNLENEVAKQEENVNKLKEKLIEAISVYQREVDAKGALEQQALQAPLDPLEMKFRELENRDQDQGLNN